MTWSIKDLLVVPDNVSNEEAVLTEPLAAGLEILEQLHIQPIERLLILGDGKLGLLTALGLHASNVDVTLVGKHQNKLDLAKNQGIKTMLLSDLEVKPEWDFVVEATGSSSGFETAMALTKPRGTLVLKSTVADSKPMNLAPIVINELRVQGSRCGRFKPALRLLSAKKVDVKPIITNIYDSKEALKAFEKNRDKASVKVVIKF
jgi:threonine dehydrogenase-like Zn-dependent dehydrogenase